jgi:hypothetical protein
MRWYADNSELNGIRGADIPDILLFGGISIAPEHEPLLREKIEAVKTKHGHKRAPIKWNFKDLRKIYQRQNQEQLYRNMLESSNEWRKEIFEETSDCEYTIILSCIESYSTKRKDIKAIKEQLSEWVFSNGLMRYAMHVKEESPERAFVILDWPDGGNAKPFDCEYTAAFNRGKSASGVGYHSGALSKLPFHDSALYTNMLHSTILQFSDLIVGASREFIEYAIGKRIEGDGKGIECAKLFLSKFRGYPNNVLSKGLNVSTNNTGLRNTIGAAIRNA